MLKNIIKILTSMLYVAKHLFKKPITLEYPEHKPKIPQHFRGKPNVNIKNCIQCNTCQKVCPTGALSIQKDNNTFTFDLEKCIFCGNCSFYCPKNVITMGNEYELAQKNKKDLKLVYKINKEDKSE